MSISCSSLLIFANKAATYVPAVSTVSGGVNLSVKLAIKILTNLDLVSKDSINDNRYFRHITKRSKIRCAVSMMPVAGNAGLAVYDIYQKWQNSKIKAPKPDYNRIDQSLKDFYAYYEDRENTIEKPELKLIRKELRRQARKRIRKGEVNFDIKINRKNKDIKRLGINHSAGLTVKNGQIGLDNMRVHLITELGRGATRRAEGAITFDGTLLAHSKLVHKSLHNKIDKDTRNELQILERLDHPNIIKIAHRRDKGGKRRPGIYVEMLPTTLECLTKDNASPENRKKVITQLAGIADALAYCHRKNIYHRDVKYDNIAVSLDGTAKLIDFGYAATPKAIKKYCLTGTPVYIAPELVALVESDLAKDMEEDIVKIAYELQDCWALACVIFECLNVSDKKSSERLPKAINDIGFDDNGNELDTFAQMDKLAMLEFKSKKEYLRELETFAKDHGEIGKVVRRMFTMDRGDPDYPRAQEFADALNKMRNEDLAMTSDSEESSNDSFHSCEDF